MQKFWLDNPLTRGMIFYPRRAKPGTSRLPNTYDGAIPVNDGFEVGYRLYRNDEASALLLLFHGNGEIVSDYDGLAPLFRELGLSVLAVDYRGYGWSSGSPLTSAIVRDAEAIFQKLPELYARYDLPDLPLFVHGRSLGSASAVHLAYTYPQQINGLIVESGLAHAPLVLSGMGLPKFLLWRLPPIFGNYRKIKQITIPTLIFHGDLDTVIPVEHGQMLYDASPSRNKRLLRVPDAGHNDLVMRMTEQYFSTIGAFVEKFA